MSKKNNNILFDSLPPELQKYVNNRVRELLLKEKSKLPDLAGKHRKEVETSEMYKKIKEATQVAADVMGLTFDELVMPNRKRQAVDARRFVYIYAKSHTALSYDAIGAWFNRDHSTVIHGTNRAKDLLGVDKNFAHLYNQFINKLTGKQYEISNISQRAADYTSGKVDVLVHCVND
jgi:hypothetical protein